MIKKVYLNPLLKATNIFSDTINLEAVYDEQSIAMSRELFIHTIMAIANCTDADKIAKYLAKVFDLDLARARDLLGNLQKHQILINDLSDYPVDQISMWQNHKWLNALIYHLKSQNINCIDDKRKSEKQDRRIFPKRALSKNEIWKRVPSVKFVSFQKPAGIDLKKINVEKTLLKRSSCLSLRAKNIKKEELGELLSLSNKDLVFYRRKIEKSTRSFYESRFIALETYVVIHKVKGIEAGVYFYDPKDHQLCLVSWGDFRMQVADICIGQTKAGSGAFSIFITACLERYMSRYKHERAYRNLLTNTAELAQQYIFFATALGLNTWLTPAIIETQAANLLKIDNKTEIPIYTVAAG